MRTEFKFTLPKGTGIKVETGRKVTGTMRLIKVRDLVDIERDSQVQRGTGAYYVVLLSRCITQLGLSSMINRKVIENLDPIDFAFLVDFMNEINHQVIKRLPIVCEECGHEYEGIISQLGEA
ncbi:MAG: hypothetical protein E7059_04780 [Treponema bryantii]|nr:hypothetical protein [Treponema bryantii]